MSSHSIENILSGSIPLGLLREDYKVELAGSVYLTGADGSRYISNKTIAEFMIGSTKKRLDKEYEAKRFAAENKYTGDSDYFDHKGRL